jgi:hypothetical protein
MATVWRMHDSDTENEDSLLELAARAGYELATRQTDTGQVVWEWQNGAGPRPQFVSERLAHHWMTDWLAEASPARSPKPDPA